jgi:hypothetical protein
MARQPNGANTAATDRQSRVLGCSDIAAACRNGSTNNKNLPPERVRVWAGIEARTGRIQHHTHVVGNRTARDRGRSGDRCGVIGCNRESTSRSGAQGRLQPRRETSTDQVESEFELVIHVALDAHQASDIDEMNRRARRQRLRQPDDLFQAVTARAGSS